MRFRHLLMVVAVSFFTACLTIGFLLGEMPPMAKSAECPHRAGDPGKVPCGNGDVNGDGKRDIADAIYILGYLFARDPAPYAFADDDRIPALEAQVAALTQRVAAVEAEQASRKPLLDDLEFGKKIAGVYCRGGDSSAELYIVSADGGFLHVNSWLSNEDEPSHPGGYFIPGFHGTWRKTGDHTVRVDAWAAKRKPYVGGDHLWGRLVYCDFEFDDAFATVRLNGRWDEDELSSWVDPSSCDAPWAHHQGGDRPGPWVPRQPVCESVCE